MTNTSLAVRFDKFEKITPTFRPAGYITEPKAEWTWPQNTDHHNAMTLTDFYAAVEWLYAQGFEEYVELVSNTISPCTQNAFLPLREYRVKRNGHYRWIKIFGRFFGGCYIELT